MSLLFMMWLGIAMAAETSIVVHVKGMVCAFCVQGIEKKVKAEPAVKSVNVSLEKSKVSITLKEGATLADQRVNEIIKSAGYNVDKIERSGEPESK